MAEVNITVKVDGDILTSMDLPVLENSMSDMEYQEKITKLENSYLEEFRRLNKQIENLKLNTVFKGRKTEEEYCEEISLLTENVTKLQLALINRAEIEPEPMTPMDEQDYQQRIYILEEDIEVLQRALVESSETLEKELTLKVPVQFCSPVLVGLIHSMKSEGKRRI